VSNVGLVEILEELELSYYVSDTQPLPLEVVKYHT